LMSRGTMQPATLLRAVFLLFLCVDASALTEVHHKLAERKGNTRHLPSRMTKVARMLLEEAWDDPTTARNAKIACGALIAFIVIGIVAFVVVYVKQVVSSDNSVMVIVATMLIADAAGRLMYFWMKNAREGVPKYTLVVSTLISACSVAMAILVLVAIANNAVTPGNKFTFLVIFILRIALQISYLFYLLPKDVRHGLYIFREPLTNDANEDVLYKIVATMVLSELTGVPYLLTDQIVNHVIANTGMQQSINSAISSPLTPVDWVAGFSRLCANGLAIYALVQLMKQ